MELQSSCWRHFHAHISRVGHECDPEYVLAGDLDQL